MDGVMASWLVLWALGSSPGWVIVLCSWARHFSVLSQCLSPSHVEIDTSEFNGAG